VTEEVLCRRGLNRSLLARQLLLERATLPLSVAMEQVAGLQTQYAPAGYVGLWSRVAGLARDDLTKALFERSVVQGTLMRSTIHMVSAADYWRFAGGVREGRRGWFLRTHARVAGGIDMDVRKGVDADLTVKNLVGPIHNEVSDVSRSGGDDPDYQTVIGSGGDKILIESVAGGVDIRRGR